MEIAARNMAAMKRSATQTQALDELLILLWLGRLQIIEQLAALIDELHEPATRGVIALVSVEVLTQSVDALGEQCNLDFGGTGVFGITTELRDDSVLLL